MFQEVAVQRKPTPSSASASGTPRQRAGGASASPIVVVRAGPAAAPPLVARSQRSAASASPIVVVRAAPKVTALEQSAGDWGSDGAVSKGPVNELPPPLRVRDATMRISPPQRGASPSSSRSRSRQSSPASRGRSPVMTDAAARFVPAVAPLPLHVLQYVQYHSGVSRDDLPELENFFTKGRGIAQRLSDPPLHARALALIHGEVWVAEKGGSISRWRATDPAELIQRAERIHRQILPTALLAVADVRVWIGQSDGSIRIVSAFDATKIQREVKEHSGAVTCFAISQNERFVFSASSDFTVVQWSSADAVRVQSFHGHRNAVRCLCVAGVRLFSGGDDGVIIQWDFATARPMHVLKGHTSGGVRCLQVSSMHLWSGGDDATVRIWGLANESDHALATWVAAHQPDEDSPEHHHGFPVSSPWTQQPPECVHVITNPFSTAVTQLEAVGNKIWSASLGTVYVWNTTTFALEGQFKEHSGSISALQTVRENVLSRVWTCGSEGNVLLWNAECSFHSAVQNATNLNTQHLEHSLGQHFLREERLAAETERYKAENDHMKEMVRELEAEVLKLQSSRFSTESQLATCRRELAEAKADISHLHDRLQIPLTGQERRLKLLCEQLCRGTTLVPSTIKSAVVETPGDKEASRRSALSMLREELSIAEMQQLSIREAPSTTGASTLSQTDVSPSPSSSTLVLSPPRTDPFVICDANQIRLVFDELLQRVAELRNSTDSGRVHIVDRLTSVDSTDGALFGSLLLSELEADDVRALRLLTVDEALVCLPRWNELLEPQQRLVTAIVKKYRPSASDVVPANVGRRFAQALDQTWEPCLAQPPSGVPGLESRTTMLLDALKNTHEEVLRIKTQLIATEAEVLRREEALAALRQAVARHDLLPSSSNLTSCNPTTSSSQRDSGGDEGGEQEAASCGTGFMSTEENDSRGVPSSSPSQRLDDNDVQDITRRVSRLIESQAEAIISLRRTAQIDATIVEQLEASLKPVEQQLDNIAMLTGRSGHWKMARAESVTAKTSAEHDGNNANGIDVHRIEAVQRRCAPIFHCLDVLGAKYLELYTDRQSLDKGAQQAKQLIRVALGEGGTEKEQEAESDDASWVRNDWSDVVESWVPTLVASYASSQQRCLELEQRQQDAAKTLGRACGSRCTEANNRDDLQQLADRCEGLIASLRSADASHVFDLHWMEATLSSVLAWDEGLLEPQSDGSLTSPVVQRLHSTVSQCVALNVGDSRSWLEAKKVDLDLVDHDQRECATGTHASSIQLCRAVAERVAALYHALRSVAASHWCLARCTIRQATKIPMLLSFDEGEATSVIDTVSDDVFSDISRELLSQSDDNNDSLQAGDAVQRSITVVTDATFAAACKGLRLRQWSSYWVRAVTAHAEQWMQWTCDVTIPWMHAAKHSLLQYIATSTILQQHQHHYYDGTIKTSLSDQDGSAVVGELPIVLETAADTAALQVQVAARWMAISRAADELQRHAWVHAVLPFEVTIEQSLAADTAVGERDVLRELLVNIRRDPRLAEVLEASRRLQGVADGKKHSSQNQSDSTFSLDAVRDYVATSTGATAAGDAMQQLYGKRFGLLASQREFMGVCSSLLAAFARQLQNDWTDRETKLMRVIKTLTTAVDGCRIDGHAAAVADDNDSTQIGIPQPNEDERSGFGVLSSPSPSKKGVAAVPLLDPSLLSPMVAGVLSSADHSPSRLRRQHHADVAASPAVAAHIQNQVRRVTARDESNVEALPGWATATSAGGAFGAGETTLPSGADPPMHDGDHEASPLRGNDKSGNRKVFRCRQQNQSQSSKQPKEPHRETLDDDPFDLPQWNVGSHAFDDLVKQHRQRGRGVTVSVPVQRTTDNDSSGDDDWIPPNREEWIAVLQELASLQQRQQQQPVESNRNDGGGSMILAVRQALPLLEEYRKLLVEGVSFASPSPHAPVAITVTKGKSTESLLKKDSSKSSSIFCAKTDDQRSDDDDDDRNFFRCQSGRASTTGVGGDDTAGDQEESQSTSEVQYREMDLAESDVAAGEGVDDDASSDVSVSENQLATAFEAVRRDILALQTEHCIKLSKEHAEVVGMCRHLADDLTRVLRWVRGSAVSGPALPPLRASSVADERDAKELHHQIASLRDFFTQQLPELHSAAQFRVGNDYNASVHDDVMHVKDKRAALDALQRLHGLCCHYEAALRHGLSVTANEIQSAEEVERALETQRKQEQKVRSVLDGNRAQDDSAAQSVVDLLEASQTNVSIGGDFFRSDSFAASSIYGGETGADVSQNASSVQLPFLMSSAGDGRGDGDHAAALEERRDALSAAHASLEHACRQASAAAGVVERLMEHSDTQIAGFAVRVLQEANLMAHKYTRTLDHLLHLGSIRPPWRPKLSKAAAEQLRFDSSQQLDGTEPGSSVNASAESISASAATSEPPTSVKAMAFQRQLNRDLLERVKIVEAAVDRHKDHLRQLPSYSSWCGMLRRTQEAMDDLARIASPPSFEASPNLFSSGGDSNTASSEVKPLPMTSNVAPNVAGAAAEGDHEPAADATKPLRERHSELLQSVRKTTQHIASAWKTHLEQHNELWKSLRDHVNTTATAVLGGLHTPAAEQHKVATSPSAELRQPDDDVQPVNTPLGRTTSLLQRSLSNAAHSPTRRKSAARLSVLSPNRRGSIYFNTQTAGTGGGGADGDDGATPVQPRNRRMSCITLPQDAGERTSTGRLEPGWAAALTDDLLHHCRSTATSLRDWVAQVEQLKSSEAAAKAQVDVLQHSQQQLSDRIHQLLSEIETLSDGLHTTEQQLAQTQAAIDKVHFTRDTAISIATNTDSRLISSLESLLDQTENERRRIALENEWLQLQNRRLLISVMGTSADGKVTMMDVDGLWADGTATPPPPETQSTDGDGSSIPPEQRIGPYAPKSDSQLATVMAVEGEGAGAADLESLTHTAELARVAYVKQRSLKSSGTSSSPIRKAVDPSPTRIINRGSASPLPRVALLASTKTTHTPPQTRQGQGSTSSPRSQTTPVRQGSRTQTLANSPRTSTIAGRSPRAPGVLLSMTSAGMTSKQVAELTEATERLHRLEESMAFIRRKLQEHRESYYEVVFEGEHSAETAADPVGPAKQYDAVREALWAEFEVVSADRAETYRFIADAALRALRRLRRVAFLIDSRPHVVRATWEIYTVLLASVRTLGAFAKSTNEGKLSRRDALRHIDCVSNEVAAAAEGSAWLLSNFFTDDELAHVGASPHLLPPGLVRRPTWREIVVPESFFQLLSALTKSEREDSPPQSGVEWLASQSSSKQLPYDITSDHIAPRTRYHGNLAHTRASEGESAAHVLDDAAAAIPVAGVRYVSPVAIPAKPPHSGASPMRRGSPTFRVTGVVAK